MLIITGDSFDEKDGKVFSDGDIEQSAVAPVDAWVYVQLHTPPLSCSLSDPHRKVYCNVLEAQPMIIRMMNCTVKLIIFPVKRTTNTVVCSIARACVVRGGGESPEPGPPDNNILNKNNIQTPVLCNMKLFRRMYLLSMT